MATLNDRQEIANMQEFQEIQSYSLNQLHNAIKLLLKEVKELKTKVNELEQRVN